MNQWGPVCVCIGRERGRAVSVQTEDHQAEAERSEGHQRPTGHDEDSNELGSCSQNQTKLQMLRRVKNVFSQLPTSENIKFKKSGTFSWLGLQNFNDLFLTTGAEASQPNI